MKHITRIAYSDGSKNSLGKAEFPSQFEKEILKHLDQDTISEYARWHFDLIDPDEQEDYGLEDFSDEELIQEMRERGMHGAKQSIVTEDFVPRFLRIIEKENSILLDNLLTEFEQKLNL
jgi:hypothetical protein